MSKCQEEDNLAKQQALISIYKKPESDFNCVQGLFNDKLKHLGVTVSPILCPHVFLTLKSLKT